MSIFDNKIFDSSYALFSLVWLLSLRSLFFLIETEREWVRMGGMWEETGRIRGRANYNQDMLYEKKYLFLIKKSKVINRNKL